MAGMITLMHRCYSSAQHIRSAGFCVFCIISNYTCKFANEIPVTVVKDMKGNSKGAGILKHRSSMQVYMKSLVLTLHAGEIENTIHYIAPFDIQL